MVFKKIGFSIDGVTDASSSSYGAAIYVQSLKNEGTPKAQLLCSKSIVTIMRIMRILRLEFCLLLAILIHVVLP